MDNLFAKNFRGLFTTYGDYFVYANRNCTKFVLLVVAIRVNCVAEHLCRVAILTLFKSHISFGERIIPFERAKTNHDKLLRENNSPVTRRKLNCT